MNENTRTPESLIDRTDPAAAVAAELDRYEILVLTDSEHLYAPEDCPLHHVRQVNPPLDDITSGDGGYPFAVQAVAAGKRVVTWCTHTPDGRDVAALARDQLRDDAGASVARHVSGPAPDRWVAEPSLGDFRHIIDSAGKNLPPAPRRPSPAKQTAVAVIDLEVEPVRTAERLLRAHLQDVLIVSNADGRADLRVLSSVGIWGTGETTLLHWLSEIADDLRDQAIRSGIDDKALPGVLRGIRTLAHPDGIDQVKRQAGNALLRLIERGELKEGQVTTCDVTELDANLRYLGTDSGVVDLESGQLLPCPEGRRALVTMQTPVAFDPGATHPDVDKLFAHLTADERAWLRGCLGCAMHGTPARRCYLLEGPPAGGKSALFNAIMGALGPYAQRPADAALSKDKFDSASPELAAFTIPTRVATIDEMPTRRVATGLLKRLMGGTRITYRPLYREPVEALATATLFMACNSGRRPRFDLGDKAMFERLRVLPYPAVPVDHVDEELRDRMLNDPEIRAAMLAWLVAAAVETKPNKPPKDIPTVGAARQEAAAAEVDEVEEFARRIAPADTAAVLTADDVWREWCEFCGDDPGAKEAGGVSRSGRSSLSSQLRGFEPRLPASKQFKVDGKKVRGWRGWRLLTVEEVEARAAADQAEADTVPLAVELAKPEGLLGPDGQPVGECLLHRLIGVVAPSVEAERERLPVLRELLRAAFEDPDATYHLPDDDQLGLGLPVPTGGTGDAGDSDGTPARVEFPPEWATKTGHRRLLWLARTYPDVMGGPIGSQEFRLSLVALLDEAALLIPKLDRAEWLRRAKADVLIRDHLQDA